MLAQVNSCGLEVDCWRARQRLRTEGLPAIEAVERELDLQHLVSSSSSFAALRWCIVTVGGGRGGRLLRDAAQLHNRQLEMGLWRAAIALVLLLLLALVLVLARLRLCRRLRLRRRLCRRLRRRIGRDDLDAVEHRQQRAECRFHDRVTIARVDGERVVLERKVFEREALLKQLEQTLEVDQIIRGEIERLERPR